jgi:DNA-binding NarL/FixJ family response regulator
MAEALSLDNSQPSRVMVVDDHPLFRTGLAAVLEREPDLKVVAQVGTLAHAVETVANTPIDLAIIDIMLPDHDGIRLTRRLRERDASARILGLSVLDEPIRIAEMMRAGAAGFVHKTQPIAEIVEAVRATLAGTTYICPALREPIAGLLNSEIKLPLEQLTAREREVFVLLVRGLTNERAGRQLSIAPRTVETHRQRIMKKLGAHSIAELVRLAARWGALT